jgi:hypothetical protein
LAKKTLVIRRTEKLAQLDALKLQIARMEEKAAIRLGRLAARAGLADLDLKDDELLRGFKAMAARFRESAGNGAEQNPQALEPGAQTKQEK